MRRRRLLAATVGALGVAGCLGRGTPGGDGDDPGETDPTTSDPGGSTTSDSDGTIDDVDCPSFVDTDRTTCYRRDGRAPDVFLVPSAVTFEDHDDDGEVQTVSFTLHTDRRLRFNPNNWAVYATDDGGGGWTRLAPNGADSLSTTLAPGETVTWSLATEAHSASRSDVRQVTATLDSGSTHAFRVFGTVTENDETVEAVAVFDYLRSVP